MNSFVASLLVLGCGSDDFATREKATEALLRLSEKTNVYRVVLLGAQSKHLEMARRCKLVAKRCEQIRPTTARYYPVLDTFEVKLKGYQELYKQAETDAQVAFQRFAREGNSNLWNAFAIRQFRLATVQYIPLLLKAGYTRKQIVRMLDDALALERRERTRLPKEEPWW